MSKLTPDFLGAIDVPTKPEYHGISGTTLINHRIRSMLQLTCEEYVIMQLLDLFSNSKDISTMPTEKRCWEYLGMKHDFVKSVYGRLVQKVMIIPTRDDKFQISPRWRKLNPKASESFEQLYELFRKKGNRAEAQRFYLALVNEISPEQLAAKCATYMKYIHQNKTEWKYQMGLDSFLDPKTKRYDDYYQVQPDRPAKGKI